MSFYLKRVTKWGQGMKKGIISYPTAMFSFYRQKERISDIILLFYKNTKKIKTLLWIFISLKDVRLTIFPFLILFIFEKWILEIFCLMWSIQKLKSIKKNRLELHCDLFLNGLGNSDSKNYCTACVSEIEGSRNKFLFRKILSNTFLYKIEIRI